MWTGGLITLGALVPALRKAGADRPILVAAARRFGRVSWTAFVVTVATGIWQVEHIGLDWAAGELVLKIALVVFAGGAALVHQLTAATTSPATRGAIQGVILLVSIGIFGAAVRLV